MRLLNILTREQKEAGLSVYEDEDVVYLFRKQNILAVWSSVGVTEESILAEAEKRFLCLLPPETDRQAVVT